MLHVILLLKFPFFSRGVLFFSTSVFSCLFLSPHIYSILMRVAEMPVTQRESTSTNFGFRAIVLKASAVGYHHVPSIVLGKTKGEKYKFPMKTEVQSRRRWTWRHRQFWISAQFNGNLISIWNFTNMIIKNVKLYENFKSVEVGYSTSNHLGDI